MFDTTIVRPTQYIPTSVSVDVQEKRAPTDESVRLLREMEQATLDSIIKRIVVPDGPVTLGLVVHHDHINLGLCLALKCVINGQPEVVKWRMDVPNLQDHAHAVMDSVVAHLADVLARGLLKPVAGRLLLQLSGRAPL